MSRGVSAIYTRYHSTMTTGSLISHSVEVAWILHEGEGRDLFLGNIHHHSSSPSDIP